MNWTVKHISGCRIRIERSHTELVVYSVRCETPAVDMLFDPVGTKDFSFDVPYLGSYTIKQIPLVVGEPHSTKILDVTNPVTPTELEQLEKMWTHPAIPTPKPKPKPTPKPTPITKRASRKKKP